MKNLKNKLKAIVSHVKTAVNGLVLRAKTALSTPVAARSRAALAGNRGEGFVDTALKILISIVVGALLLTTLYALFGDTIMPTLKTKITELFSYNGT